MKSLDAIRRDNERAASSNLFEVTVVGVCAFDQDDARRVIERVLDDAHIGFTEMRVVPKKARRWTGGD